MENQMITKSGSLTESRRKFLENAGLSLVLGTFGAAFFTSCSTTDDANPTTPPGNSNTGITVSGNTVTIDLTVQTALNASGSWLLIENARTLVANINGAFVALTSVCTHSGCSDRWSFGSSRFTCTCHGSVFDASGRVLNGPASAPLEQFTTQVTGTTLRITK